MVTLPNTRSHVIYNNKTYKVYMDKAGESNIRVHNIKTLLSSIRRKYRYVRHQTGGNDDDAKEYSLLGVDKASKEHSSGDALTYGMLVNGVEKLSATPITGRGEIIETKIDLDSSKGKVLKIRSFDDDALVEHFTYFLFFNSEDEIKTLIQSLKSFSMFDVTGKIETIQRYMLAGCVDIVEDDDYNIVVNWVNIMDAYKNKQLCSQLLQYAVDNHIKTDLASSQKFVKLKIESDMPEQARACYNKALSNVTIRDVTINKNKPTEFKALVQLIPTQLTGLDMKWSIHIDELVDVSNSTGGGTSRRSRTRTK